MKKLSNFFYRISNVKLGSILFVAMIIYASVVMGGQSDCFTEQIGGQKILGLKFGYEHPEVQQLFGALNEEGLRCYKRLLTVWDNIFPLIYGFMYIVWLSLIFKNTLGKNRFAGIINLVPILSVLLDWVENFHEKNLLENFMASGNIDVEKVHTASLISQTKWSVSYSVYLIIILGAALFFWTKAREKKVE